MLSELGLIQRVSKNGSKQSLRKLFYKLNACNECLVHVVKYNTQELAGSENIVKVYAKDVPEELKVKFTKPKVGSKAGPELFDISFAKLQGNEEKTLYMYLLIKPKASPGAYEFNVVVEVLGS